MGALAQRLKPVLMPALLALLLALLPGRAWLPGDWRLLEGLTALTPQWLALALALGVRALWQGRRLRAMAFVLLTTPDLVSALRPDAGVPIGTGTDFTLYAANLGRTPAALGVALETLQATAPDVLAQRGAGDASGGWRKVRHYGRGLPLRHGLGAGAGAGAALPQPLSPAGKGGVQPGTGAGAAGHRFWCWMWKGSSDGLCPAHHPYSRPGALRRGTKR